MSTHYDWSERNPLSAAKNKGNSVLFERVSCEFSCLFGFLLINIFQQISQLSLPGLSSNTLILRARLSTSLAGSF